VGPVGGSRQAREKQGGPTNCPFFYNKHLQQHQTPPTGEEYKNSVEPCCRNWMFLLNWRRMPCGNVTATSGAVTWPIAAKRLKVIKVNKTLASHNQPSCVLADLHKKLSFFDFGTSFQVLARFPLFCKPQNENNSNCYLRLCVGFQAIRFPFRSNFLIHRCKCIWQALLCASHIIVCWHVVFVHVTARVFLDPRRAPISTAVRLARLFQEYALELRVGCQFCFLPQVISPHALVDGHGGLGPLPHSFFGCGEKCFTGQNNFFIFLKK